MTKATAADHGMDIAIIDDEEVIREMLQDFLSRKGNRVRSFSDGASAVAAFGRNPPDLALLDVRMPGEDGVAILKRLRSDHPELPVILVSGHGTIDTAIDAMRLGAVDFLRKPIRLADLVEALERTRRMLESEAEHHRLSATIARSQKLGSTPTTSGYIGSGNACREVLAFLEAATRTPFDSVLITGETGSGKDVVARELHARLRGTAAPFVAVNCPALPDTLVESELFGHMKGSFTGADGDRPGAFEMAIGGTLFLDEIGDLASAAQAKLLRALESRQVRRLGGRQDIAVDVTVIAATNQDLPAMVQAGTFRRDLLYRLNTFQLALPPLRAHPEDIPVLARHFLAQFAARRRFERAEFKPEALAALSRHDFPGNTRELRNLVERAVMLSPDGEITPELLSLPDGSPRTEQIAIRTPQPPKGSPSTGAQREEDPEVIATREALIAHRWNRRAAAKALSISYEALRWRIAKHALE
ncbi:type 4 fimbriae expression regulatory protein PilR [Planctomycetota bacterium]|nr:type 4 fimbriae expression regulatory protein PilR [Planctomycetota bacterium]